MWKRNGARLVPLAAAALLLAGCEGSPFGVDDFLGCDEVRRVSIPATIDGDLTRSDCRLPEDDTPVDYYTFTVNSTRTVYIDMESDQIDSYLYLFDEDGFVVDQDDDSGFELDASLATQLGPGRYIVAANTFDQGSGVYRLTID